MKTGEKIIVEATQGVGFRRQDLKVPSDSNCQLPVSPIVVKPSRLSFFVFHVLCFFCFLARLASPRNASPLAPQAAPSDRIWGVGLSKSSFVDAGDVGKNGKTTESLRKQDFFWWTPGVRDLIFVIFSCP